jgi:hypothetical protein
MSETDSDKTPYNPFCLTNVWPHTDCPPVQAAVLDLNCNGAIYFAEIEQAAFSPSNIVPGIGYSPDIAFAEVGGATRIIKHSLGACLIAAPWALETPRPNDLGLFGGVYSFVRDRSVHAGTSVITDSCDRCVG